jgi:diadenosine tetraphosphatase ApaH/serine/threonine PP2A family protein phosphatase
VLTALLSDIHGNREALEACLADARTHPIDRYAFLGDYVGYGADPGFVLDTVAEHVARGAIAVFGNHDAAACGAVERMTAHAAEAAAWTAGQLTPAQIDFLQTLPLSVRDGDILYVHASAGEPRRFRYITDESAAGESLLATDAQVTFCGHTHVPALYHLSVTGKIAYFDPTEGVAIPLSRHRRWLAVIGAVGQPRDHDPAACYGLFDEAARTLTYVRVPYDTERAAAKIRAAGLPEFLAARLAWGR